MIDRYRKQYKIVGIVFTILVLFGIVMLFRKIEIGIIDGKTLLLLIAFSTAAYQDNLVRKLFKQLRDSEKNQ